MGKRYLFLLRIISNSVLAAIIILSTCFAQDGGLKKYDYVFHYNNDESIISSKDQAAFSNLIKTVSGEVVSISVDGHTDRNGTHISNVLLSRNRAELVYVLIKGLYPEVNADKIKVNWYAETRPVGDFPTKDAEDAANRRVEVTITTKEPYRDITIEDLYKSASLAPQLFCINNNRDTAIVARQGTIIYIKAHSIQGADQCAGCITVAIKEALNKSDIVREHLTTVSGSKILVSQSMVYVGFKCGNKALDLLPGKDYVIMSPTDEPGKGSKIYYGEPNPLPGHFEWTNGDGNVDSTKTAGNIQGLDLNELKKCAEEVKSRGRSITDRQVKEDCANCRLLFCGAGKWVKGWFNAAKRKAARDNFNCRREYKEKQKLANKPVVPPPPPSGIYKRDSIQLLYGGIKNSAGNLDSCDALPDYCDRLLCHAARMGINDSLLNERIMQASIKNTKDNNPIKITDVAKLRYNSYPVNRTGWSNIDWMMGYQQEDLQPITIMLSPNDYTDCTIIFKEYRTVLPPVRTAIDRFVFPLVPKGMPAWLLMINTKTGEGKVDIQIKDITTGQQTIVPQFKRVDGKTFIEMLNSLDD